MQDIISIQAREPMRTSLAEQMAAYEAEFGPVQTLPIRVGNVAAPVFSIAVPGKPKPEQRSRKIAGPRKLRKSQEVQLAKIERVKAMVPQHKTVAEIAAAVDWSVGHTQKILAALGLKAATSVTIERDSMIPSVREMAARGATIEQMAQATGRNRKTIINWIADFKIERGPRMDIRS